MDWCLAARRGCFLAALLSAPAAAQSIEGLTVGSRVGAAARFGAPGAVEEISGYLARKWSLPDKNDLSITATKAGSIVYIEKDWIAPAGELRAGIKDFAFGTTTLAHVRESLGSNGFSFADHMMAPMPNGLVMFNCYGSSTSATIATCFVTLVSNADRETVVAQPDMVSKAAHLVAVIVADTSYLKTIWGSKELFDPANKPVDW